MAVDGKRWGARLDELAARHKVPGANLAILSEGEVTEAATGVINRGTGVETTTDSVFQIGSITKVYTTTLVMQLVDEGRVDLDGPVVDVLPELALADPAATKAVTMRHLLTHTSGIHGDHFVDTGRGDEAVERFVATCAEVGLVHPVGATMSYCNTGFVIAGRVIETVTGSGWDEVLRDRLIHPLGLTHTVTLPEEALRFRAAYGHPAKAGEEPQLAPTWVLPRSAGPAGLICARPADVIAFARLHLSGGVAPDGTRLLSEASVAAMQQPQVELPETQTLGRYWGLGWILYDWGGRRVIGHDGGTIGQQAFLRVVPDAGVAVCLLTNGGYATDLYQGLMREILAEVADVHMPEPPVPPSEPVAVDTTAFAGSYEREGLRVELEPDGSQLRARLIHTGPLASVLDRPVQEVTLVPVNDRQFVTHLEDEETWSLITFYELDDGSPYVHMGGRASPKVG